MQLKNFLTDPSKNDKLQLQRKANGPKHPPENTEDSFDVTKSPSYECQKHSFKSSQSKSLSSKSDEGETLSISINRNVIIDQTQCEQGDILVLNFHKKGQG